ncbi:hypothetical protein J4227_04745 [Candidatus Woesearchaeota archaeon]|nr:hypothetical protein [Candidatus Woesearchaeota archaeon]
MTRDRTLSRKAQNWGMDVMIGIGIFVLGLGLFFYIVDKKSDDDNVSELLRETEKMSQAMVASEININNPCAFIIGNKIDKLKLEQCSQDYPYSKILLGIRNDYCVYFVDKDGNLINISAVTNKYGIGFGSTDINYTVLDEFGIPQGAVPCST